MLALHGSRETISFAEAHLISNCQVVTIKVQRADQAIHMKLITAILSGLLGLGVILVFSFVLVFRLKKKRSQPIST